MFTTETGQPSIIALWSAPRCRSTAFLRMMVERGDRTVVHEPFSLLADFGRTTVGDRTVHTEDELIDSMLELGRTGPVFFKDTTDFRYPRLVERTDFLGGVRHTMIVRHPAPAITSHHRLNPALQRDEIGFSHLAEIYDRVVAIGPEPVVIDSDDLVTDPAGTVRAYCTAVGIPFLPDALRWEAGMREEWASTHRWHRSTSSTTGFDGPPDDADDCRLDDPILRDFAGFHLPYYHSLRERRTVPARDAPDRSDDGRH